MGQRTVVHTVFGKHHKYEVVKDSGDAIGIAAVKYYVWRDGKPFRGSFSSLSEAVQAAEAEP